MPFEILDKVIPGVVAGVISVVGAWWAQRRAQRFQEENLDKAMRVERHSEAVRRAKQLLWMSKDRVGEDWVAFMTEMEEWFDQSRLILVPAAEKAFQDALNARGLIDTTGNHPAVAHHLKEPYEILRNAPKIILDASPRYGPLAGPRSLINRGALRRALSFPWARRSRPALRATTTDHRRLDEMGRNGRDQT